MIYLLGQRKIPDIVATVTVHPHQHARERIAHKLPLDLDGVPDDRLHALLREIRPQEGVDQAGETRRSTSRSANPSSREINSLEKVKPGMSPRFLSQKIEQKLPEKKIPSEQAKATLLSAKV
ncbi:hypothetical protein DY000_02047407 [Brassica cretica]|uniref:Uncharacterized protein n=1 Tax=Brassica cretica TaxID=69181 RepID=A0ABQ7F3Y4_BRACR|nr:hypothetical protein DY000_02047407 [Brassica cretica]